MTNSSYVRSALAQAVLEITPPLICETLLKDSSFREEYGIRADAVISLGDSVFSGQRSELFEAFRKILSGTSVKEVTDKDGQKWKLKNINVEGELPSLELSRDNQRLVLPGFAALSPDVSIRLRFLDEVASDINLPSSVRDTWHETLSAHALDDDEIDAFHSEFFDTPVKKARSICKEIRGGQSSASSLVPPSRRYFEKLVGTYDGSTSIRDYAAGSGRAFFEQLSEWKPYDGFLSSLFLSSHSSLTAEINVDKLGSKDLVRAFDFLDEHGDRTSQLGAIEVGLRILLTRPEIEPVLIRLIEQIRDDDVDGQASDFNILSALFFLVDGELSRIRLFTAEPPFYRRLAALSQAALIHRQLVKSGIDTDAFCKWAKSNRGEQYYLQSLADMRLEPRWYPELAAASQMKADFFGRIMIAAKNYEQNIKSDELTNLVLATEQGSLYSLSDPFQVYLPGPLEGAEESQNILPADIAETVEKQLGAEKVDLSSFITLVNSALIFRVGSDQASLAAKALKLCSYRLANIEDRSQLLAILFGLANVAAVARSCSLADELRILVRRYRRDAQYALSIKEAIRICLVTASSRADLNDWRNFVGDWLTELAFGDLEGNDGEVFYWHLKCLCHAVPELWVSCGRVDAALMAYNASRNPT